MATRFRKSVNIAPGLKVNANKGSVSITAGTKGAHITKSSNGTTTRSVGIPGTGLSYVSRSDGRLSHSPADDVRDSDGFEPVEEASPRFANRTEQLLYNREQLKAAQEQLKKQGKCIRCYKITGWADKYGYCYACHNAVYVEKIKFWAGDDSEDAGILYSDSFPRKIVCRRCGEVKKRKEIEERTGYCLDCIDYVKTVLGKKAELKKKQEDDDLLRLGLTLPPL